MEPVSTHYSGGGALAERIADDLRSAGLEPTDLCPADLEPIDEFHFRGRAATLELAAAMNLTPASKVLDIGSGLGGVARTIAEAAGAHVTGVDLTQAFCDAANAMSDWVGLGDRTEFRQGDATRLPFPDKSFDAAVTVHVAMNIRDKAAIHAEAHRVLKPGSRFAVYDILQGEGGEVLYPAPWAADPSISHLATPAEMTRFLGGAGFRILEVRDTTAESHEWLRTRTSQRASAPAIPVTTKLLFGDTAGTMTENQLLGLAERRMLTVSYICEA